jgi:hypothetical protein
MNFVLLPAIARLPELPSKYRAVAGPFSKTGAGILFFGPVQGHKIIGLDEVSAAGTRGEK